MSNCSRCYLKICSGIIHLNVISFWLTCIFNVIYFKKSLDSQLLYDICGHSLKQIHCYLCKLKDDLTDFRAMAIFISVFFGQQIYMRYQSNDLYDLMYCKSRKIISLQKKNSDRMKLNRKANSLEMTIFLFDWRVISI